ncbi:5'-nucleotidase C-terminal domain-containing protein [Terribacillus saccharophilus]|uniref:5'-nucleotidase C-terminal domain-containing protein n=1 Tax=Terribacillus saccharophilus TaxID=361277 RepID=UPI0039819DAC
MRSVQYAPRMFAVFAVLIMLFYSLFGVFSPSVVLGASGDESIELKVLHTNDFHANIDDFGKIAAYIDAEREQADRSLYLDAGDIFSGNPVVDLQYGKPIVDLLNDMGVQAMTMGNHDFDYGQEETINRMKEAKFPWLSANTIVGENAAADFPQPEPYKIFDVDGLKVGVLSLTETPPSTSPDNTTGITFEDPIETAKKYGYLEDETDVFIALSHLGYSEDQKLAAEVDSFDVIIGAHSHTTLNEPKVVNGTPIVQTGSNGTNVGNLTITYNPQTQAVEKVDGFLQPVSALTEVDAAIQSKVDQYNAEMEELLTEEIGHTDTGLSRSGSLDTALGNFWTDAMRFKTESDVALTNNGGIRANIPAGKVTVNDIYTIEPFANQIMKYEMTGAALKEVIKYSYERRSSVDLQTSGLHYKIITNNTGRYIDAELEVDGAPIEDDKTYIVAVGDYIGTGGSGYNFDGKVLEALSGTMTDAMIAYAKHLTAEGENINYSRNERITTQVSNEAPIDGTEIGRTENGLSSANNGAGDSGLGNLYTDSIRSATDADFAILNGSSVAGNIPAGTITDKQIEFLDSFGNEVAVVKTTLDKLKEVILTQSNYHNSIDVQVSGLHYELIKENNKFTDVIFTLPDGSPLDESKEYTVAYNDYMHGGSYYNLADQTVDGDYGKVWETVVKYVSSQENAIDYREGTRISITDNSSETLPEERNYVTVAEAIAANEGTKTVQGYIVGTMTGKFDGDFTATNLMLADSPNERNMEKIIPVQLPTGSIRSELNLVDNPDNLGELVQITGDLETYFSVPGLKTPSTYEFVEEESPENPTEPGEPKETIAISDARQIQDGEEVTIEGVVTTNTGGWGSKGFYVQDETAGIYVFQNAKDFAPGDLVRITGVKGQYGGEMQIASPTSQEKIGDAEVPAPIQVTPATISAQNEAQLVQLENVTISNLQQVNDYGTFEFTATSENGESVLVRVDNRTGLVFSDFAFENDCNVTITGVSSQFNGTIQLKPRGVSDIVASEEPVTEDPGTEEPGTDPGTENPGTEEPGTEEPGTENPGTEEPGTENPGTEEPGTEEPGTENPGTEEPGTENPGTEEPGTEEPGTENPGTENPGTEEPGTDDPGTEPGTDDPGIDDSGSEPGTDDPGIEPGTDDPGTKDPDTQQPDKNLVVEPKPSNAGNQITVPISDGTQLDNETEEGKKLPDTATPIYNWILMGCLTILLGGTVLIVHQKRVKR